MKVKVYLCRIILKLKKMVKSIILTAIKFKGIEQVKREVKELAENCLCTESYIKSIIKKVENNQIIIM